MKINYLQEAYIKDINTLKAAAANKTTADSIRADAKKVWAKMVEDFMNKFGFEHCNIIQIFPKTTIFLQDVNISSISEWSWSNVPLWGKPHRGTFDIDSLREAGREVSPIIIKNITADSIHIDYNLGHPVKILTWSKEYNGEYGEFEKNRAIAINCNNLYNRYKAGREITKDVLATAFIKTYKDVLKRYISYGDEIEKADLPAANFILNADIIIDNIIIDLPRDLYIKAVITKEKYDEAAGKWITLDLPFNENDITLIKFIRERLDKIFTFTGPGKLYLKRGRDIISEI